MQALEFNALPLSERTALVFSHGRLLEIFEDTKYQKAFYYKLNELKIDVIYDRIHNKLLDIIAWDSNNDRVAFLKIPV